MKFHNDYEVCTIPVAVLLSLANLWQRKIQQKLTSFTHTAHTCNTTQKCAILEQKKKEKKRGIKCDVLIF